MANYQLSDEADQDLNSLYKYGVCNHGLDQANRYAYGLLDRLQNIAEKPYFYPAVDEIKIGYRRSVYGVHSIYYTLKKDQVLIVRILRGQTPEAG